MNYRELGKSGVSVSVLALGGHEYHPDGRLKGFTDHPGDALKPGYVNAGFGSAERRALVTYAVAQGITYFDATIDPEVAALGECLAAAAPMRPVLVQCRPQGMCYQYDPGNRALADLSRLRPEVERLAKLGGRRRIDVLNFGFEAAALTADPTYLERLAATIGSLKAAGLIRFAACDSLQSGESHYLRVMQAGCFDLVWLNFGPLCPFPAERLFPLARRLGMGVVVREAFQKGNLFRVAEAGGFSEGRKVLADAAIRWILNHRDVSCLVTGVRNVGELEGNLIASGLPPTSQDQDLLERLGRTPAFVQALAEQKSMFLK